METKINYKTYEAVLKKNNEKWVLCLCLEQNSEIDLSAKDQEYLKNVFNVLIKKMIEEPFNFSFKKSEEEEAKGLNEVCEKYISILNNDLKGVYEEYLTGINEITLESTK